MRGTSGRLRIKRGARPFWQRLLVTLTLVVFAQAGYLTQTHIHPAALAGHAAAEASPNKTPARDDSQHCPICQEYLLAGTYLIPPPLILLVANLGAIQTLVLPDEVLSTVRFSYGWQSRAPPRF